MKERTKGAFLNPLATKPSIIDIQARYTVSERERDFNARETLGHRVPAGVRVRRISTHELLASDQVR